MQVQMNTLHACEQYNNAVFRRVKSTARLLGGCKDAADLNPEGLRISLWPLSLSLD